MSPRQKSQREHKLAKEVLCAIVDNKELQEKGIDYLIENGEEIASISAYIVDMIKVYISKWIKYNVHNKSDEVLEESCIQPDLIEEDAIEDVEHKINQVQKLEPNKYQHVTIPSVGKELALSMQGNSLE